MAIEFEDRTNVPTHVDCAEKHGALIVVKSDDRLGFIGSDAYFASKDGVTWTGMTWNWDDPYHPYKHGPEFDGWREWIGGAILAELECPMSGTVEADLERLAESALAWVTRHAPEWSTYAMDSWGEFLGLRPKRPRRYVTLEEIREKDPAFYEEFVCKASKKSGSKSTSRS